MILSLLASAATATTNMYPLQCTEEINCDANDKPIQITCHNSLYDIQKPCSSAVWSSASNPSASFDLFCEATTYFKSPYFVWTIYSDSDCTNPSTDYQYSGASYAALLNTCAKAKMDNGINSVMIYYDGSSSAYLAEFTDDSCQSLSQALPSLTVGSCKQLNCNEWGQYQQITCQNGLYNLNSTCGDSSTQNTTVGFDIIADGLNYFESPFMLWTVYSDSSCTTVADDSPYINSSYAATLNTCVEADYYNAKSIQVLNDWYNNNPDLVGYTDKECLTPAESLVELKVDTCIPYHGYYQKITVYGF
ncbi:hypothetical protein HDV06_002769 [Boothiomyces sp. JEL0866]|nr:hypothetical protein HDV06_002769 [Boothiomyces sp. JEL0866]